jgi:hypothetical protein
VRVYNSGTKSLGISTAGRVVQAKSVKRQALLSILLKAILISAVSEPGCIKRFSCVAVL